MTERKIVSVTKVTPPASHAAPSREVWRITVDGQQRSISTSVTSSQAINEAARLYSGALKRLADK